MSDSRDPPDHEAYPPDPRVEDQLTEEDLFRIKNLPANQGATFMGWKYTASFILCSLFQEYLKQPTNR